MNSAKLRILEVANFHRLRKFSQAEKSSGTICSSKTEHLQQNKIKKLLEVKLEK